MLRRIQISNYALIEQLDIELNSGFTAITGETGAGKSILLGALGLVLGNRADTGILHDKNSKCFVEASFNIKELGLEAFFIENDLDYENECTLSREISVTGKSRAFINDTPVSLNTLKALGEYLVDIHSQHDSLHLTNSAFQLSILDGLCENEIHQKEYSTAFQNYQSALHALNDLKQKAKVSSAEHDLIAFQHNELEKASLQPDELDQLELRHKTLSHAEEIRAALFTVTEQLNRSELNVLQQLRESYAALLRIKNYFAEASLLAERLQNCIIEIKDIAAETENAEQIAEYEPEELERVNQRISFIHHLLMKYHCKSVSEIIELHLNLGEKINAIEKRDFNIEMATKILAECTLVLSEKSQLLTASRKKMIPEMEQSVRQLLIQLGMPNAMFEARMQALPTFSPSGTDSLQFYFTANKGTKPEDIAKIASGGELSRLMLAIKSLTSGKKRTPTIIFDEIDTGVSGEIAAKVGRIMAAMAHKTQLISITHLPQIAGKANQHLLVFKRDDANRTKTMLAHLDEFQRIDEVARMLSDDVITEASRLAAKELISGF